MKSNISGLTSFLYLRGNDYFFIYQTNELDTYLTTSSLTIPDRLISMSFKGVLSKFLISLSFTCKEMNEIDEL